MLVNPISLQKSIFMLSNNRARVLNGLIYGILNTASIVVQQRDSARFDCRKIF